MAAIWLPPNALNAKPIPFESAQHRYILRLIRMVASLHKKGLQRLRIFPYIYPIAFRLEILPVELVERKTGVRVRSGLTEQENHLVARYSSANEKVFFGWQDAASDDADDLALKFIARFQAISKLSQGVDWAYVGWLATLIGVCEYGYLPYLFSEYESEFDGLYLLPVDGRQGRETFKLPPDAMWHDGV